MISQKQPILQGITLQGVLRDAFRIAGWNHTAKITFGPPKYRLLRACQRKIALEIIIP